jgi:hypothetical protein
MKPIITILFCCILLCAKAQPLQKPIAIWNNANFWGHIPRPIFNDSVVAFVWQDRQYTYVKSTQQAYLTNATNLSTGGYQTAYTRDGYYFVKAEKSATRNYDSIYFFSYNDLKAYNLGLCGTGNENTRFLYQREPRDTLYYLQQMPNQSFQVYQLAGASARNININLNTFEVNEFYANKDTFIYVVRYKDVTTKKIAVRCKIGSSTRTLFEHYSDSFSINSIYTANDKVYFYVDRRITYNDSFYESNYQNLDAVPSSFTPDKKHTERMKDGSVRKINFDQKRVERFDATGLNLLSYTNFPEDVFLNNQYRSEGANGNVWVLTTNDYGTEPCLLTPSDSFVNMDISQGMYSSFNYDTDNYLNLTIPGDTAFALLRNIEVDHRFIYRLTGNSNKPFEPIVDVGKDTSTNHIVFFKAWDRQIYWLIHDASRKELRLYSAAYNLPSITVPKPDFGLDKHEWHRQLGFGKLWSRDPQINTGGINLVDSGEVIVSAFSQSYSGVLSQYGSLMAYQDQYKHRLKAGQFTVRLKANGQVAWITSYGKVNDYLDRNFHQVIDQNGDVYVTGQAGGIAIFGSDTIRANRGAINFLVKLNGKTGELLWYKTLFKDINSDKANVEHLAIDSANNLYVAIMYKDFEINLLGTTLSNQQVSPANALLKLSAQGDLVWAINTITPFTKNYGMTRAMLVDNATQKVVLVQSIGYYNWWSSCKYSTWHTYLQSIDISTGKTSWTKLFESDDLHSTTSITLNKQGDIMLAGYFRGTITLDDYTFTSLSDNDCERFQPFYAVINSSNGEALFAHTSETDLYYPFEMKTAPNGTVWTVGAKEVTNNRYSLSVAAVNEFGVITHERNFKKSASPFSFGFFPTLAVNDRHVVLADAVEHKLDTFKYCFDFEEQLSVLKLAIEHIPSTVTTWPKDPVRFTNYQVMLYPNPVKDQLMLITNQSEEISDIQIIDITGRELQVSLTKQATYQEIDVSALPAGVYVLIFNGKLGRNSLKFVKAE